jgi:NAD(P)-dependent dehydrogenase (short-subunit alcohol dehydrogenase family)
MGVSSSSCRLSGRVAVVTGASRGIGAAIAERLGSEGATVVVAARTLDHADPRFPGTLRETAEAVGRAGGRAVVATADLSVSSDRQRLVAVAEAEAGPVDILINNAAVTFFRPVDGFDLHRYDLMFEVQVKAPFHLAQLVLPGMRERGEGWIVNVSSGASRHPTMPPGEHAVRGGTVYGMCKAALERLSTGLAAEVYNDGVTVNALSPARVVPTPGTLFHGLVSPDSPPERVEHPAVMAEAALLLASAPPHSLTGRVVTSAALLKELGVPVPADPSSSEPEDREPVR